MSKAEKTHYRKVFKSDHLSSADLEDLQEQGVKLIFTIREVTPPTSVHDYDTGDIDNDGDIDIIFVTYRQDANLTNHKSGYPYIYLNDGQAILLNLTVLKNSMG